MTTLHSIQVTSGAAGRRGRLRAKVAAGAVALGCAAALALGGLRAQQAAHHQPQAAPAPSIARPGGSERQRFLDANLQLPDGTLALPGTAPAWQRFLDANTQLPDGVLPVAAGSAQRQWFVDANLWLLGSVAPATVPAAGRSNLR